jgi:hypothetical protein
VRASLESPNQRFLSQSIYVDHLVRWRRFLSEEQMLILKSEDFLYLPGWEPEAADLGDKVNRGKYDQGMSPEVRRRLEAFFEPHNQRLY